VVDGVEDEHGDDERQEQSTTKIGWSGLPTVQHGLLGIPPRACDVRRCEGGACHKRGAPYQRQTKGRRGDVRQGGNNFLLGSSAAAERNHNDESIPFWWIIWRGRGGFGGCCHGQGLRRRPAMGGLCFSRDSEAETRGEEDGVY
jgi:hypothetical protein